MKTIKDFGGGDTKTLEFLLLLRQPSYIRKLNNIFIRRRNGSWPRLI